MYKKLNKFNDEITSLRNISLRKEITEELKNKVTSNVRDLYNELYYIYKNKYKKERNNLDTENREKLGYKKLRLSDDMYLSEEEQEEKAITDTTAFNEQINKEETGINTELFKKHFNFQRPSDMLKSLTN